MGCQRRLFDSVERQDHAVCIASTDEANMRFKAAIRNKVTRHLFSLERRNAARAKAEQQRVENRLPHQVEYFHDVSDPYAHLMVQILPAFCDAFDIELRVHLVSPPPDWAAPDRARLVAYARQDAAQLAARIGLIYADPGAQPSPQAQSNANAALLVAIDAGTFLETAFDMGQRLWSLDPEQSGHQSSSNLSKRIAQSTARRDALGHYLGATLYYAGEWYWGPDRLHYLDQRLRALGAARPEARPGAMFEPPTVPSGQIGPRPVGQAPPQLHWYLSFRSPYTGIVADRVKALADAHGAQLRLRFVLPMVMRGMKVPKQKGFYIMRDVTREAERMGIPFGNSCDPVGAPVERGYAILPLAIEQGLGFEFVRSFLSGVWADGLDAGSNKDLKMITERAGLSWPEAKALIGGGHWQETAESNRQEMFEYGLWGVPSFRVGDVAVWGQDRLWLIDEALLNTHAN